MKIFIGEIPENPCYKCWYENGCKSGCWQNITDCIIYAHYSSQQSILNQCVEVDFSKFPEWCEQNHNTTMPITMGDLPMIIEQFIQEQIEKKEQNDVKSS